MVQQFFGQKPVAGLTPISCLVPSHHTVSITSHPTSQAFAEKSQSHFSSLSKVMFSRLLSNVICFFKPCTASVGVSVLKALLIHFHVVTLLSVFFCPVFLSSELTS